MSQAEKTPFVRRDPQANPSRALLGLSVLQSPDRALVGQSFALAHRLCFGREAGGEVDIAVDDPLLSRVHAAIERNDTHYVLRDRESTNGTFVNGRRALDAAVVVGTLIRAGDTLFLFQAVSSAQPTTDTRGDLLGDSQTMIELRAAVDHAAPHTLPLLILGETGTGKELVARRAHDHSGRKGAFVPINCGAIPVALAESIFFGHKKGAFSDARQDQIGCWQAADGGTLFLDEIGEMSLELQAKLLRLLGGGTFSPVGSHETLSADVRVVSATNVDLTAAVAAGAFRHDLLARLQGYVVHTPALRDRREDILPTLHAFMARAGLDRPLTIELAEHLVMHDWPMNMRELSATAQRFAALGASIAVLGTEHLPRELRETSPRPASETPKMRRDPSEAELRAALTKHGGNVLLVAEQFGRDRKQIYRWLKKFNLDPEGFR